MLVSRVFLVGMFSSDRVYHFIYFFLLSTWISNI